MHLSLSATFAFFVVCQLFLVGHISHFSKLQSIFVASLFARKSPHCIMDKKIEYINIFNYQFVFPVVLVCNYMYLIFNQFISYFVSSLNNHTVKQSKKCNEIRFVY